MPAAQNANPANKPAGQAEAKPQVKLPVLENAIGMDGSQDTVTIYTPQSHCCNCGTRAGLTPIDTRFIQKSKYSTNFDNRLYFDLALPYCKSCAKSANKYPVSSIIPFLVGFVLWTVIVFGLMAVLPMPKYAVLRMLEVFGPIVPVVLLFRWLASPKAPQTSKYTPVQIKEFSGQTNAVRYGGVSAFVITGIAALVGMITRAISGKDHRAIERLSFKFSNLLYAKAFQMTNGENLKKGLVKIII